jgi:hypothetical protein
MNQTKIIKHLPQLLGKTIESVCFIETDDKGTIPNQVFLSFTDGTNYEIYSSGASIGFTGVQQFSNSEEHIKKMFGFSKEENRKAVFATAESIEINDPA